MLDSIKRFFDKNLRPEDADDQETREREIRCAAAALLIEMARADFQEDDLERALILAMLRDTFDLEDNVLDELVKMADAALDEAHDVYQFTQLVNDHYSYDDKQNLIAKLWHVAYADGRLDRYEEQFIKKVAGLLHVSHPDLIKAKVGVMTELGVDQE